MKKAGVSFEDTCNWVESELRTNGVDNKYFGDLIRSNYDKTNIYIYITRNVI